VLSLVQHLSLSEMWHLSHFSGGDATLYFVVYKRSIMAETGAKVGLRLLADLDFKTAHLLQTHFMNTVTLEMRMCCVLANKIATLT
jgi:hypothetical protein